MTDRAAAAQPNDPLDPAADLPRARIATLAATRSRPARTERSLVGPALLHGALPLGGDVDRALSALSPLRSTEWMTRARCRDHPPAVFFPEDGARVEIARRICEACPVTDACLAYALVNHIDHGVWGGTSERARRRMLRARPVKRRTGHSKSPNPSRHAATEGLAPRQSDQAKSATSTQTPQGGINHVRPRRP